MTQHVTLRGPGMMTATVSIKIFEDPEHGLHVVRLSLHAGIETVAPGVWHFDLAVDANNHFESVLRRLKRDGFREITRETL